MHACIPEPRTYHTLEKLSSGYSYTRGDRKRERKDEKKRSAKSLREKEGMNMQLAREEYSFCLYSAIAIGVTV